MKRILFILLFIHPVFSQAQIKKMGTPSTRNYPKSVYQAGTQNWDITQDENGFMYFANNEGVYIFENGRIKKWNTPVNSLLEEYRLYSATKLTAK